MVEDLRNQLRVQDIIPTREGGGVLGDIIPDSQRNFLQIKIDSLSKYEVIAALLSGKLICSNIPGYDS